VECRRYGWAVSGAECGVKWAPSQLGRACDTSRSRSIRKKNSPTSSRPGIGSLALATGSLHPFSPSPPTGRPRPAAPVAVSLRTPALPPRERTLDCASQRLRHPPRQILSNQPIDPPRPPPVVRACRLCCSCGFQFRSLFVPTDCFPL
jgi:hypothetical protein